MHHRRHASTLPYPVPDAMSPPPQSMPAMYHHELDAVGDGVLGGVADADADADACARERERRAALRRSARKEGLMGEALSIQEAYVEVSYQYKKSGAQKQTTNARGEV
jgi:hypothetical protein